MLLPAWLAGALAFGGFVAAAAGFFVAGRYRGVARWQRGFGASLSVGASTYLVHGIYAGEVIAVANPGEPRWVFWTYPAAWLFAHVTAYHFYRQRDRDDDRDDGPGGGKRTDDSDGSDGGKRADGPNGGGSADGPDGGSADAPDAIVQSS